jgi:hypothetical protein
LLEVLDMSLYSGGRFGAARPRNPCFVARPLARQTLQFDEDRPAPLMPVAPSALSGASFGTPKGRFYRNKIKYLR